MDTPETCYSGHTRNRTKTNKLRKHNTTQKKKKNEKHGPHQESQTYLNIFYVKTYDRIQYKMVLFFQFLSVVSSQSCPTEERNFTASTTEMLSMTSPGYDDGTGSYIRYCRKPLQIS